jgi:hypothetical protein
VGYAIDRLVTVFRITTATSRMPRPRAGYRSFPSFPITQQAARKTSGKFSLNSARCSGVSQGQRSPAYGRLKPQISCSQPGNRARPCCEPSSAPSRLGAIRRKSSASIEELPVPLATYKTASCSQFGLPPRAEHERLLAMQLTEGNSKRRCRDEIHRRL